MPLRFLVEYRWRRLLDNLFDTYKGNFWSYRCLFSSSSSKCKGVVELDKLEKNMETKKCEGKEPKHMPFSAPRWMLSHGIDKLYKVKEKE